MKGLYTVNYKILIIEAEYKGKVICNHWLEELILLKCPYYLKQLHTQCDHYHNSNDIFHKNITILKFVWNHRSVQEVKVMFSKKNKSGGIMLPDHTT